MGVSTYQLGLPSLDLLQEKLQKVLVVPKNVEATQREIRGTTQETTQETTKETTKENLTPIEMKIVPLSNRSSPAPISKPQKKGGGK